MLQQLLIDALAAAYDGGQAILNLYERDIAVEYKDDTSPLTAADRAANEVIIKALARVSDAPVLSEESRQLPYAERRHWKRFWLVDPLDGTKEFIKRNGEFTVNIALVESGRPVLGVVYAPVMGTLYAGTVGAGAYKAVAGHTFTTRAELLAGAQDPARFWEVLPTPADTGAGVRVVASRSHQNDETRAFITALQARCGEVELVSIGSSLKICLVAEGRADVYPRIAPTMEWDTGAAQAVLEAAGGTIVAYGTDEALRYNKENLLNPYFVASRSGWERDVQASPARGK